MTEMIKYIYAGMRLSSSNKKRYAYIESKNLKGDVDLYSKKLHGLEMIGTIIECEKTETGVKAPYKVVGKAANGQATEVANWSAIERANLEKLKEISLAKKEHTESINNKLKWLKDSMHGMNRSQKDTFALWVYKELLKV
ncbi:MAG: hypothetical protein AAFX57_16210 [Bacteroidota bacterium]